MNTHINEVMEIMLDDDYDYWIDNGYSEKEIYDSIKNNCWGNGCPTNAKLRIELSKTIGKSASCPDGGCNSCWTNMMKYVEEVKIAFIKF